MITSSLSTSGRRFLPLLIAGGIVAAPVAMAAQKPKPADEKITITQIDDKRFGYYVYELASNGERKKYFEFRPTGTTFIDNSHAGAIENRERIHRNARGGDIVARLRQEADLMLYLADNAVSCTVARSDGMVTKRFFVMGEDATLRATQLANQAMFGFADPEASKLCTTHIRKAGGTPKDRVLLRSSP
jgi:hypothetical protein